MALLCLEGFDTLRSEADFLTKYSCGGTSWWSIAEGRFGGNSFYGSHNTYGYIDFSLPSVVDTVYVGFAIRQSAASSSPVIKFYNVLGSEQCGVSFNYVPILYRSSTFVESGSGSTHAHPGIWNYIEIKATVSNSISADDFIVIVNGDEMLNVTAGTDTQYHTTSGIARIRFQGISRFDDIYICDTTGSKNNTFLGDTRVSALMPNAVGASSDFAPSDSTSDNYEMVNDDTNDGDVTYVESSGVGDLDLYNIESMSETPNTVDGISVSSSMKKSGAGDRTAKITCQSDGTNSESIEIFPGTSYQYLSAIFEDDPATGTAWTGSGVDAAQFGLKVES